MTKTTKKWCKTTKNSSKIAVRERNLTFSLLDPDQIRKTLCYTMTRYIWGKKGYI